MVSRKIFSVKEVIELVCMPDGALSDAESEPDDDDNDPDFDETQARDVDDESDEAVWMMNIWNRSQEMLPTT